MDIASQRSLVLLLEDIHWADEASLGLLRRLSRRSVALPLLLVVTYRAEDVERWSHLSRLLPVIVRESSPERIELRPLDRDAVDSIVSGRYELSPRDLARLVDYLMQRAEGNAFYTLELLRGLEQQDLLVETDGGWRLNEIDSLGVPRLLRQVIDARLERLEPEIREHLAAGAVIGQHVPVDLWSQVLDVPEEEIFAIVDRAAAEQLIDLDAHGTSMGFRHALIRDALYQSLLPMRRRRLHRQVGRLLTQNANPDPDTVAWHLQASGDDDAPAWLMRAADRAQRSYAWATAAERLIASGALRANSIDPRERGWIHYRVGRLLRHSGAVEAMRWLRDAEDIGNRLGDASLSAFSRFDLGHLLVLSGEYQQGIAEMMAGDQLLDQIRLDGPTISPDVLTWVADAFPDATNDVRAPERSWTGRTASLLRRGTLVQWLAEPGRFDDVIALGEPYVEELKSIDGPSAQLRSQAGDAWFGLARSYAAFRQVEKAQQAFERALECYEGMGHHLLTGSTRWMRLHELLLPFETFQDDELRQAADAMESSYRRASGALPPGVAPGFGAIELHFLRGAWQQARDLVEPMVTHQTTMASWRHRAAGALARLARDAGDSDRAWQIISDLLPDGSQTEPGSRTFSSTIELQLVAAHLSLDASDLEAARAWLLALNRWLSWSGAHRWRSAAMVTWARYYLEAGDLPLSRKTADEALRLATAPDQPLALITAIRFQGEIDLVDRTLHFVICYSLFVIGFR